MGKRFIIEVMAFILLSTASLALWVHGLTMIADANLSTGWFVAAFMWPPLGIAAGLYFLFL